MMEPFIGEIMLFAGNFAPRGWAFCNGQILNISQNSALFSIIGTTYGGNGVQTFALPNLQGRTPIHFGQGHGLKPVDLGETLGFDTVTLNQANLPDHTHSAALTALNLPVNDIDGEGDIKQPSKGVLANTGGEQYSSSANSSHAYSSANLGTIQVASTGNNIPFDVHQPSLALNYCIALEGIFPSRS